MSPYLLTLSFLVMMSLISSSQMASFVQSSLEKRCFDASKELLVVQEELRELSHLEELRAEQNQNPIPKKKPNPLTKKSDVSRKNKRGLCINGSRPPNNSRLNFFLLLNDNGKKKSPQGFSLYEVAARLMKELYHHEPFFQASSGIERRILEVLIKNKDKTLNFTSPDLLLTLDFEDEELQTIFYLMLKGTKTAPSLLNYITFDPIEGSHTQKRKINLLFASPELLLAIFGNKELVDSLIIKRKLIWEQIAYQEDHFKEMDETEKRRDYSEKIKNLLRETLLQYGMNPKKFESAVFDCTLGKPGSLLFLEDPTTGTIIRQKYNRLK